MLCAMNVSASASLAAPVTALRPVLPRICVRPPYYALQDVSFDGGLQASVRALQKATREQGPMRAAEISRHAAIAGLACAALNQEDDQRRYYLATEAHYYAEWNEAPYGSEVFLETTLLRSTKRDCQARTLLYSGGRALATLEVRYSVLNARLFEKLFAAYQHPTPHQAVIEDLPRNPLRQGEGWLEHHVPALPAACCAGHFDCFPALPVALLVAELSYLSEVMLDRPTFVREAHVRADRLCWAGQSVTFRTELQSQQGQTYGFLGQARAAEGVSTETQFVVDAD